MGDDGAGAAIFGVWVGRWLEHSDEDAGCSEFACCDVGGVGFWVPENGVEVDACAVNRLLTTAMSRIIDLSSTRA